MSFFSDFFGQKDKRNNDYLDNYLSKYEDLFKLGLVMAVSGLICYGVYELFKHLFF
tara:strand:- start:372 stop:539 length:168 start_codon:yes stop_codon:yes gene_type:complete